MGVAVGDSVGVAGVSVGVTVGVSVGVSDGVGVMVGVAVGVTVFVGVRVAVAVAVSVGVAEGDGVDVLIGALGVIGCGGTGVSLTNTPRSLIENCRSMSLVSAKLRAANKRVFPLTDRIAFLGFSTRTYSVSRALHDRVVPPAIEPSNTITPSTPT